MGSSGGVSWKLEDHPKLPKGKVVAMVVLDGWGEAHDNQYNCISVAETPTMDSLKNVFIPSFLSIFIVLFYCFDEFLDFRSYKFGFGFVKSVSVHDSQVHMYVHVNQGRS